MNLTMTSPTGITAMPPAPSGSRTSGPSLSERSAPTIALSASRAAPRAAAGVPPLGRISTDSPYSGTSWTWTGAIVLEARAAIAPSLPRAPSSALTAMKRSETSSGIFRPSA